MNRAMETLKKVVGLGMDGVSDGLRRYARGKVICDPLYSVYSKAPLPKPSEPLRAL